jgi:serine protease
MRHSFVCFSLVVAAAGCGSSPDTASSDEAAQSTVPVDFPGKAHGMTPAAAAKATLQYYGGPVIPSPKVYVVWWGDPSKINPVLTATKGGIADYFAGITNSKFMDWMNEYDTTIATQVGSHKGSAGTGQRIGRGNYVSTITMSDVPAGNVTDQQIQDTLNKAFDAGTLPEPDENTIYAIYFPASVSISLDQNGTSCSSFGAYHEAAIETTRHNAFYLVMPDCGFSFSGFTSVTSHELIEAVTDPIPTPGSNPDFPQAWNDVQGSESGDLCEGSSGTIATAFGNFKVQGIWDEASHGCKTFRSYKQDYNVSFATNSAALTNGTAQTFTVQTANVAGATQALTLAVTAPAGVTAQLAATKVTSGKSTTLTVTASGPVSAGQIIVRADGKTGTGSATQSHTAALLVNAD